MYVACGYCLSTHARHIKYLFTYLLIYSLTHEVCNVAHYYESERKDVMRRNIKTYVSIFNKSAIV